MSHCVNEGLRSANYRLYTTSSWRSHQMHVLCTFQIAGVTDDARSSALIETLRETRRAPCSYASGHFGSARVPS